MKAICIVLNVIEGQHGDMILSATRCDCDGALIQAMENCIHFSWKCELVL